MSLLTNDELGADRDADRTAADAENERWATARERYVGSATERDDVRRWIADRAMMCDTLDQTVDLLNDVCGPDYAMDVDALDWGRKQPEHDTAVGDIVSDDKQVTP